MESREKWVEEREKEEDSQLRLTWNQVANHKELAKTFSLVPGGTRRIWLDKGGFERAKVLPRGLQKVGNRVEPGMLRGSRFE